MSFERSVQRPYRRGDAGPAVAEIRAKLTVLVLASVDTQLTSAKQESDGGARLHEAVAALNEHISILPGPLFSATGRYQNHIRINSGNGWSPEQERALVTLGRLCDRVR